MYVTSADSVKSTSFTEYLPDEVQKAYSAIPADIREKLVEIRIKNEGLVSVTADKPLFLHEGGELLSDSAGALITDHFAFRGMIDRMSHSSIYASQNELKNGFLTLQGGHRVGVCGRTVVEKDAITALSDLSSVNIRISRAIVGAADAVLDCIMADKTPKNTLLISPPACGKTTILRDIARQMGGGKYMFKVGISDERGEIASMQKGKAQLDVGPLTDVYHDCPKAEGMKMLLRSMSPDVIITDELGTGNDEEALFEIINAGVKVICSAHGYDVDDLLRRGLLGKLIENRIFENIIILSKKNGPGTIEKIY